MKRQCVRWAVERDERTMHGEGNHFEMLPACRLATQTPMPNRAEEKIDKTLLAASELIEKVYSQKLVVK